MNNTANKFNATVEFLNGHEAYIELSCARTGEWAGAERLTIKHGHDLYEASYKRAETKAALKGGRLETFRVA